MKSLKLAHVNCGAWQAERELLWETCLIYTIFPHQYTKKETKIYRDFFFTGDFENLLIALKPKHKPVFSTMLDLYPAKDLDDVLGFTKHYWAGVLSENSNNFSDLTKSVDIAFNRVTLNSNYSSPVLKQSVFRWYFGSEYTKSRNIDIENLNIKISVSAIEQLQVFLNGLHSFLFKKAIIRADESKHFYELRNYMYSLFPFVSNEIMSINFPKVNKRNAPIINAQFCLRRFLLGFLFKYDFEEGVELEGMHPEMEEIVKRELFESSKMPPEFHQLIEYLKSAKGDSLEI